MVFWWWFWIACCCFCLSDSNTWRWMSQALGFEWFIRCDLTRCFEWFKRWALNASSQTLLSFELFRGWGIGLWFEWFQCWALIATSGLLNLSDSHAGLWMIQALGFDWFKHRTFIQMLGFECSKHWLGVEWMIQTQGVESDGITPKHWALNDSNVVLQMLGFEWFKRWALNVQGRHIAQKHNVLFLNLWVQDFVKKVTPEDSYISFPMHSFIFLTESRRKTACPVFVDRLFEHCV